MTIKRSCLNKTWKDNLCVNKMPLNNFEYVLIFLKLSDLCHPWRKTLMFMLY